MLFRATLVAVVMCSAAAGVHAQKARPARIGYSAEHVLMWRKGGEALKSKDYRLAVLYFDFLWQTTHDPGARVKLAEAYAGRYRTLKHDRVTLAARLAKLRKRLRRTGYPVVARPRAGAARPRVGAARPRTGATARPPIGAIQPPLRVRRLRRRIAQTRRRLEAARAGLGKTKRLARCARNLRCNLLRHRGADYVVPRRCLRNPRCKLTPAKICDRAACVRGNFRRPCCARFKPRLEPGRPPRK